MKLTECTGRQTSPLWVAYISGLAQGGNFRGRYKLGGVLTGCLPQSELIIVLQVRPVKMSDPLQGAVFIRCAADLKCMGFGGPAAKA